MTHFVVPSDAASSLHEEGLCQVPTDTWSCPSPAYFRMMGFMTEIRVQSGGTPEVFNQTWNAMLLQKGYIMQHAREKKLAWMVCESCHHGAYLWRMAPHACKLHTGEVFRWLEFATDRHAGDLLKVKMLTNLDGYRVAACKAISPIAWAHNNSGAVCQAGPRGIAILLLGARYHLASCG